jgi:hypothetical protein
VRTSRLSGAFKGAVERGLHTNGVNFAPPRGTSIADVAELRHVVESAVAAGTRSALIFATVVVVIGALVSLLIPKIKVPTRPDEDVALERIEALGPVSGSTVEPTAVEWQG